MSWKARRKKWDWRAFLTADEAQAIAQADIAKRAVTNAQRDYRKKFQRERMLIVNRAIQRAKYTASAAGELERGMG